LDAPDFPIAPVDAALGVDTVFVASDGVNVALLALTDGYGDWVGNVTPLNASAMNVTELFMYGVPGRSYVRCGKSDVPFPHIGSPGAQFSHSRDCSIDPNGGVKG